MGRDHAVSDQDVAGSVSEGRGDKSWTETEREREGDRHRDREREKEKKKREPSLLGYFFPSFLHERTLEAYLFYPIHFPYIHPSSSSSVRTYHNSTATQRVGGM